MSTKSTPAPLSTLSMSPIPTTEENLGSPLDLPQQSCADTPDKNQLATNVTDRKTNKKRKLEGTEEDTPVSLNTFSTFSDKQERRFEDLMGKISSIIQQNTNLMHSVEVMSSKYDEFLKRIATLELERKQDKKTIHQLEEKLELLERKSRSTSIEIRNIPKTDNETKEGLRDLVLNMGTSMNVEMDNSKIRDAYRVTSRDNSHLVIVDFSTIVMKDKVINAVKKFNKTKSKGDKLNTSHFGIQSPTKPVYLSECLTRRGQRLYYQARTFQRSHDYQFCWTSNGIVYLRKKVNEPQIRVNSELDIEKLKCTE